jgi:hypothetical protein
VREVGTFGKDWLLRRKVARPERFELPTFWFVARRSIQLSYGRKAVLGVNVEESVSQLRNRAVRARRGIRSSNVSPSQNAFQPRAIDGAIELKAKQLFDLSKLRKLLAAKLWRLPLSLSPSTDTNGREVATRRLSSVVR